MRAQGTWINPRTFHVSNCKPSINSAQNGIPTVDPLINCWYSNWGVDTSVQRTPWRSHCSVNFACPFCWCHTGVIKLLFDIFYMWWTAAPLSLLPLFWPATVSIKISPGSEILGTIKYPDFFLACFTCIGDVHRPPVSWYWQCSRSDKPL